MTNEPASDDLATGQKKGELSDGCCLLIVLGGVSEIVQFFVFKDAWLEWMGNVADWAACPLWLAIVGYFLVLVCILAFLAWVVSKMGTDKQTDRNP